MFWHCPLFGATDAKPQGSLCSINGTSLPLLARLLCLLCFGLACLVVVKLCIFPKRALLQDALRWMLRNSFCKVRN